MKILTDALHRIAYSTDASAYRQMPIGVAYPQSEEDIIALLQEARRRHTHLIPRAGGTSIAGQVVGSGIVMDVSRYMNRILQINAQERWVKVQPGVVRDELNLALRPYNLFFSPETSTSNRCCIGGMVGNNSCGTHSLIYGSTRHHVIGLRCILSNGEIVEYPSPSPISSPLGSRIMEQLSLWQQDKELMARIQDAFPDTTLRRRSCGYALDECLSALPPLRPSALPPLNLPALITGSEGTLAIVTEITLSLDELPPSHKMVLCAHLRQMDDSWQANLMALHHHPSAVELLDGKILELAKSNIEADKNRWFVQGDPASLVIAEFMGDSLAELDAQADALEQDWSQIAYACTRVYDQDVARVWALRKAGLGVLSSMPGDAKPIGVIEDTAVAVERLADYIRDIRTMLADLGLECVYYGHISTGELHLRPIINIKTEQGRRLFREVAVRTAHIVKRHHGSLSGEHGDGRLRGEFIPLMYGEEIYELFRQLKRLFDPDSVLNMGKIVDTPPMDAYLRYSSTHYPSTHYPSTHYPSTHYPSTPLPLLEQCNGSGDCRKSSLIGGTMCPAFQSSKDELRSTRARANVLREVLSHGDDQGRTFTSPLVQEMLDSCLACKGCKSECPSNVDMTRLRSEVLQQQYDASHIPWRVWLVAHMPWMESLGAWMPDVYNFFASHSVTSAFIKRVLHFASQRHIPTLSRHSMRYLVRHMPRTTSAVRGRVYLFADEFTNHEEAELGLQFAQLLTGLGYDVQVPEHVQSGRAAISKGCLHLASRYANRNVELLRNIITEDTPLVGIEPSCILSFRDEYPRLVDAANQSAAQALTKHALLYDEFLMQQIQAGKIDLASCLAPLQPDQTTTIMLHGHCHQKALIGVDKTAELLRQIPNADVQVIPSGCCGMAGAYGYEAKHYTSSMAIGEMVLFPAIRQAIPSPGNRPFATSPFASSPIVCAPGTSCRHQILDGTGVHAYHPIEVIMRSFCLKNLHI